jgi:hypothetical protein
MFLALVVREQRSFKTKPKVYGHTVLLLGWGTRRSCDMTADAQCELSVLLCRCFCLQIEPFILTKDETLGM